MDKLLSWLLAIGLILLGCFIAGIFVMWLWNWLMPIIFQLPVITFWQAVGLAMLCRCLFGTGTSSSSKD